MDHQSRKRQMLKLAIIAQAALNFGILSVIMLSANIKQLSVGLEAVRLFLLISGTWGITLILINHVENDDKDIKAG